MPTRRIEDRLVEPITQHMRSDFARLGVEQTVSEALAGLRQNPPEGAIIYFYVVDGENRLAGVVPTRRLLLSPPERRIGEIMVREVVAVPSAATVLDACEFFTLHRLLALPVVDPRRRILGIVDVGLYTDELADLDRSARTTTYSSLSACSWPKPSRPRRWFPSAAASPGWRRTSSAASRPRSCRACFAPNCKRRLPWRCSFPSSWPCPRASASSR